MPILFVGVGEQPSDLIAFDKYEFVDSFLDAIFLSEDDDGNRATFGSANKTEAKRTEAEEESIPQKEISSEPTLEEISRLHTLEGDDKQYLIKRLKDDGYDLLSRHFVRDQNTWNDFKLLVNEDECQWEIHAKDGKILKIYPLR